MSYIALATTTLGSTATSVTFSNIPNTYKDLIVVVSAVAAGSSGTQAQVGIRLNGDGGSNYSNVAMAGGGSSTFSGSQTTTQLAVTWAYAYVAPTQNNSVTQIMDYSATDKHKTALNRTTLPDGATIAHASRWANTSAVTSLSVVTFIGSFASGATFSLYGVA
jgi:hypothetical protein